MHNASYNRIKVTSKNNIWGILSPEKIKTLIITMHDSVIRVPNHSIQGQERHHQSAFLGWTLVTHTVKKRETLFAEHWGISATAAAYQNGLMNHNLRFSSLVTKKRGQIAIIIAHKRKHTPLLSWIQFGNVPKHWRTTPNAKGIGIAKMHCGKTPFLRMWWCDVYEKKDTYRKVIMRCVKNAPNWLPSVLWQWQYQIEYDVLIGWMCLRI